VSTTYDVAVIGSGPGGYVAAIRAGQLGLKTALIEKDPFLGGTCLHRGCIPTKELLHTADIIQEIRDGRRRGIVVENVSVDMEAVHKRKAQVVDKLAKGVAYLMKKHKVDVLHGRGALAGPGRVAVTADGRTEEIAARNIVLATGSAPKTIPGMEPDGKRIITSDEILHLTEVPRRLAVLGAGAVGVEFASIYLRLGSQVALVEMLPRIVPLEDEEVSAELLKAFRKRGIEIHVGTRVEKVETSENGVKITAKGPEGQPVSVEADVLLMAVGRRPVTEGLGIEKTRILLEKGFIAVGEHLMTREPNVFAIGDLLATQQLAHVASAEGIHVMEWIAGKNPPRLRYETMPAATYCDPEIASVGLTESEARQRGHKVKVGRFPFSALGKAMILASTEGWVKIVTDETYGEVLGVHIIGPRATEMIAEACAAMRLETTAQDLAYTVHPHPTLSEAMREAAEDVHGEAIHI
jgi:dihydrolipoamide dehydrogenase